MSDSTKRKRGASARKGGLTTAKLSKAGRAKLRKQRLQETRAQEEKVNWHRGGLPMWGKTLVAVAAVVLLMLVLFRVRTFEVSGNVRYTADEVTEASGLTVGDVLIGVNKTRAASRILTKLPYVKQVVISRVLPGTVKIEIVECTAMVAATADSGTRWLINQDGKLLEKLDDTADLTVPLITGTTLSLPTSGAPVQFDDADRGNLALAIAGAVDNAELQSDVETIDVSDLSSARVLYQSRIEANLGDGSDIDYKLSYLKAAAAQLDAAAKGTLDLAFAGGDQAVFHPMT